MNTTWTEARMAQLTELWKEGVSARLIANEMGLGKNAIIGKAHRLELKGRDSPIRYASPKLPGKEVPRQAQAEAAVPPAAPESEPTVRSEAARVTREERLATMARKKRTQRAETAAREKRAERTAQATTQRWKVSQAQTKSEQNIRKERGQELLPWAMPRQFTYSGGMRFRECQYIAGKPTGDDACKCRKPTSERGIYCPEHELRSRRKKLALGEEAV